MAILAEDVFLIAWDAVDQVPNHWTPKTHSMKQVSEQHTAETNANDRNFAHRFI